MCSAAVSMRRILVEHARRHGFAELTLEVQKRNAAAIALYAGHGFVPDRLLPRYYEDGADGMRMRKALGRRPRATEKKASKFTKKGVPQNRAL